LPEFSAGENHPRQFSTAGWDQEADAPQPIAVSLVGDSLFDSILSEMLTKKFRKAYLFQLIVIHKCFIIN
jgi:hypothetical protein